MTTPVINFHIPLDFDPSILKSDDADLKAAVSRAYETWGKVKTTLAQLEQHAKGERPQVPKRKLTPSDQARLDAWAVRTSSHKAELARKSQPKVEAAGAKLDNTLSLVRERRNQLVEQLDKDLQPKAPTDPRYTEIRTVIREIAASKGGKRPVEILMSAIEQGDRDTIGAVISAPTITTGLTPKEQQNVRDFALRKWFPDKVEALKNLDSDLERAEKMRDAFLEDMVTTMSGLMDKEAQIIQEGLA